jgi:hypothetical protein
VRCFAHYLLAVSLRSVKKRIKALVFDGGAPREVKASRPLQKSLQGARRWG